MVIDIPISELMTKQVIYLSSFDGLEVAEKTMKKNHIRHLPILNEGKMTGILSLTDLQRVSFANTLSETDENMGSMIYDMFTIEQIMTHHPVFVDVNDGIIKVLHILSENEFHALPVLDDDELVGIITSTDVIKYFLSICES